MTNPPQAVTERYVSNLLKQGKNYDFELCAIAREVSIVQDVCVGVYYTAILRTRVAFIDSKKESAVDLTPVLALRRALEKFGVTFR